MPLRVNTAIYSDTSVLVKVDNQIVSPSGKQWKFVALEWEQTREKKIVRRIRQDGFPQGKTSGKYEVKTATAKMLRDSALDLCDYLTDVGNGSYGDADFTIQAQVSEPVPKAEPITYTLREVTIDGEKESHEEGIDELVTEFTIGVVYITRKYRGRTQQLFSAVRRLTGNL